MEHGERVHFQIISGKETGSRKDELERYLLAERGHGLVAFNRSGDIVMVIAGHYFGRAELEAAIAQAAHD